MKDVEEIIAALPEESRKRVETRADELIAEELSLRDLRKALQKTQVEIAKMLDIGQEGVSRLEKRTDMLLSTLNGYVTAMGGELNLVASFPDRPPVVIKSFADIAKEGGAEEDAGSDTVEAAE